jgi:hypothetical protein
VGQITPPLTFLCLKLGDPTKPLPLTGLGPSNIVVRIQPGPGAKAFQGGGTVTIVDATNGIILYQSVATDWPSAGIYQVRVVPTFPSPGGIDPSWPIQINVEDI